MRRYLTQNYVWFAYGMSAAVLLIAAIAWAQGLRWHFTPITLYQIFPLLGLGAFSLIWSVYVVSYLRNELKVGAAKLKNYYNHLTIAIFILFFFHPLMLIGQLWHDGYGLPPESYLKHFVMPNLKWAALIGTIAWIIFVAYELRFKFRDRRWWKYVTWLADAAFAALYFHALYLGHQLQSGWFRYLWFFYGIVLAWVFFVNYRQKIQPYVTRPGIGKNPR